MMNRSIEKSANQAPNRMACTPTPSTQSGVGNVYHNNSMSRSQYRDHLNQNRRLDQQRRENRNLMSAGSVMSAGSNNSLNISSSTLNSRVVHRSQERGKSPRAIRHRLSTIPAEDDNLSVTDMTHSMSRMSGADHRRPTNTEPSSRSFYTLDKSPMTPRGHRSRNSESQSSKSRERRLVTKSGLDDNDRRRSLSRSNNRLAQSSTHHDQPNPFNTQNSHHASRRDRDRNMSNPERSKSGMGRHPKSDRHVPLENSPRPTSARPDHRDRDRHVYETRGREQKPIKSYPPITSKNIELSRKKRMNPMDPSGINQISNNYGRQARSTSRNANTPRMGTRSRDPSPLVSSGTSGYYSQNLGQHQQGQQSNKGNTIASTPTTLTAAMPGKLPKPPISPKPKNKKTIHGIITGAAGTVFNSPQNSQKQSNQNSNTHTTPKNYFEGLQNQTKIIHEVSPPHSAGPIRRVQGEALPFETGSGLSGVSTLEKDSSLKRRESKSVERTIRDKINKTRKDSAAKLDKTIKQLKKASERNSARDSAMAARTKHIEKFNTFNTLSPNMSTNRDRTKNNQPSKNSFVTIPFMSKTLGSKNKGSTRSITSSSPPPIIEFPRNSSSINSIKSSSDKHGATCSSSIAHGSHGLLRQIYDSNSDDSSINGNDALENFPHLKSFTQNQDKEDSNCSNEIRRILKTKKAGSQTSSLNRRSSKISSVGSSHTGLDGNGVSGFSGGQSTGLSNSNITRSRHSSSANTNSNVMASILSLPPSSGRHHVPSGSVRDGHGSRATGVSHPKFNDYDSTSTLNSVTSNSISSHGLGRRY